ncbi:hypothetical protein F5Y02DRAFT_385732 [Annulohypoxylon stygium]|nr:hypothetical protein F5Y02DRAFT_385732 [Annulohypoxylon stygium]
MVELKEYDDKHPVHWSEVFPTEDARCSQSPVELWFNFKLESIRPCLAFLERLLRLVLPYYLEIWNECEISFRKSNGFYCLSSIRPSPGRFELQHKLRELTWSLHQKAARDVCI